MLGLSDENKAILYTEIPEWGTPQQAEDYVDLLEDNNPKKWYLKGILWSRKKDQPQPLLTDYETVDSVATDSADVAPESLYPELDGAEEDASQVKHYLAYFHHAFRMQPKYLRLYYGDGQIDEETRKKYKYTRKDVPEYERLFTLLQRRDAQRREKLQSLLMGMDEDGFEDTEKGAQTATDSQETETDNGQPETNNP